MIEANNQTASWDGSAPTASTSTNPTGLLVYAYTNVSGGADLNYAASSFNSGGPVLSDITVAAASGGLAHPGTTLGNAGTLVNFGGGAVHSGTWTYSLDGTNAAAWAAGAYTSTVTYTATSL